MYYHKVFDEYKVKPRETLKVINSLLHNKKSSYSTPDEIKINKIVSDEPECHGETL